jgi:dTDP-4-amino-4,6-dideoxygalactose transaminase
MPNVNAALGCAQMDRITAILANKRETADKYAQWGALNGVSLVRETQGTTANYWLNAMVVDDKAEREEFLTYSNANGVQTRPIWVLMNKLPMYQGSFRDPLPNSEWLEDRVVNLPSSVRL